MTDREIILNALPNPIGGDVPKIFSRPRAESADGWELFEKRFSELGGRIVRLHELQNLATKSWLVDEDARGFVRHLNYQTANEIWEAEVGVTVADCAVAETGSLLIRAAHGRRRMASLAPPLHVAFVKETAIVETLDEAMPLAAGRTSVIITGPSRTADIAGTLIRGVHGPGEVWVIRCDEQSDQRS